jgi:hypothetical protein
LEAGIFWMGAFRLALCIQLFHIADDGLPAAIQVFIAAHERAARAKVNCDRSPDQSNIAVLPSPKNAVSSVQP